MSQRLSVVEFLDPLTEAFAAAGQPLYLVGGVVRGLQLGAYSDGDDLDLTTPARPEAIKQIIADVVSSVWVQGERFGTIGARFKGRPIEITTHRAESYGQHSRKPEVSFGDDLETDLSRRDFTINAMAMALPQGGLVDPYGGRADLENRRLRTPLDPEISFGDDPLRMLRAARFITRFELTPTNELEEAAAAMSSRLEIVSVERVQVEIELLLSQPEPRTGLQFLQRSGIAQFVFGELFSIEALEAAATPGLSLTVRRCALIGHNGPADAREWLLGHRYPSDDTKRTTAVVGGAHELQGVEATAAGARRFVHQVGPGNAADIFELARLRPDIYPDPTAVADVMTALGESENLEDLTPPLTGAEIMKLLDIEESPVVGEAMAWLVNARLESGPISTTDAAALLRQWWSDRSQPQ